MNEDCTPIQENIIQNNKLKNKLKKVLILFKDYEDIQFFNNLEIQLNKLQSAYDIIPKLDKKSEKMILPDSEFYSVVVGSFDEEMAAKNLMTELKSKKIDSFIKLNQ